MCSNEGTPIAHFRKNKKSTTKENKTHNFIYKLKRRIEKVTLGSKRLNIGLSLPLENILNYYHFLQKKRKIVYPSFSGYQE